MRRRVVMILTAAALGVPSSATLAQHSEGHGGEESSRWIVVLKDDAGDPGAIADEHGRRHGGRPGHIYRHALRGYAAVMSEQAAAQVAQHERVRGIERDNQVLIGGQITPRGLDRVAAPSSLGVPAHLEPKQFLSRTAGSGARVGLGEHLKGYSQRAAVIIASRSSVGAWISPTCHTGTAEHAPLLPGRDLVPLLRTRPPRRGVLGLLAPYSAGASKGHAARPLRHPEWHD